ncbi:FAD-dependent oxidoreductase [Flavobacteriaceae bacterium]|jgi:hypothetical protein|nr:FAD-dependent oxidoreductase [Flavobacteriaceae bacterium]MDC0916440.1 FAD-dependent oxidoreductase [Flavobacteriaceae bacterium]MDC3329774.1 FAD-dependent oxidoreductase [Flavobacteriaceae bacterium]
MRYNIKLNLRLLLLLVLKVVFIVAFFLSCTTSKVYKTDVLVIGGGTAGTAAAISSARMDVATLLLNDTPWLGGMLTAAGVSAVDGNTKLLSGFWGEFRDSLVRRYGSPEALKTGWVSNHMFEPAVGAEIFLNTAQNEPKLTLWMNTHWKTIEKQAEGWLVTALKGDQQIQILAGQLIDATELGDVSKAVGVPYEIGMDSRDRFGEAIAPEQENQIIQDLTYVLILEEFDEPVTLEKPTGYDPSHFYCATVNEKCKEEMKRVLWPKEQMITYGKLPNKKYMINWPINGNDFYANGIESSFEERQVLYEQAKLRSKRFLYYLQTELGFTHLGISKTEFPTSDGFPLIPYHRESRRIYGVTSLNINHLAKPYEQEEPLYKTGIAVGDYPVDHHHEAHPQAKELPELHFYPVPSYNIPLGCLIPKETDHFLVTEKSISVSNLVNGTTRLQPVALQLGQAAGITAALAHQNQIPPRAVSVRSVQRALLSQGGYLFPYLDVPKEHPHFKAYQKIGASGILRGTGKNVGWENQTWLYTDLPLRSEEVFFEGWDEFFVSDFPKNPTVSVVLSWLKQGVKETQIPEWLSSIKKVQEHFGFSSFDPDVRMTRGQFAVLIDALWDPFSQEVDLYGRFTESNPIP